MASGKALLNGKHDEILRLAAPHGAANMREGGPVGRKVDVAGRGLPAPEAHVNAFLDSLPQ